MINTKLPPRLQQGAWLLLENAQLFSIRLNKHLESRGVQSVIPNTRCSLRVSWPTGVERITGWTYNLEETHFGARFLLEIKEFRSFY